MQYHLPELSEFGAGEWFAHVICHHSVRRAIFYGDLFSVDEVCDKEVFDVEVS
jgi:hypothetical protein